MQDVRMKLHPGLPWKNQNSTKRRRGRLFLPLKFKEEPSKMLHLEHSFVRYGNLDTSEIIPEIPGKL